MAPLMAAISSAPATVVDENMSHPAKKLKADYNDHIEQDIVEDEPVAIKRHPLNVKPLGNAYTATENSKAHCGAFSQLPDEVLVIVLEYFSAEVLVLLGSTCKYLYAFTRADELWRDLFVQSPPPNFQWLGTWRATYLQKPPEALSCIPCPNVFSDVLHRPFQCAHTPLDHYARNIPRQNQIARLADLTEEDFRANWMSTPFILTHPVTEWPIYQKWNTTSLLQQYSHISFRAEAVDWPLETYISYMHNSSDESPLYLFDRSFDTKMGLTVSSTDPSAAYWPPTCFGEDFFDVLGPNRPDRRWLIVGPARSGSTFHKDPNATSAWNAVLTGTKYWLMFPNAPPGIILSADSAEITAPLSIAEYLLTFHELARQTPGCIEAICGPGEVLYVPSGWFHLVLNLEEGVAVTQNFVPRAKVPDVLSFLRDKPDQVSGFKKDVEDPYKLWTERLGEEFPEVLREGMLELERRGKKRRTKWEEIVKGPVKEEGSEENGGFSFGFGGDEEEEMDAPDGGFSFGFGGDDNDAEVP